MTGDDKNSTRAGRSINNLDDRKGANADPGNQDSHGNSEPDYKDDILETEEKAALDHVQVSGVGDVDEDGGVSGKGISRKTPKTG